MSPVSPVCHTEVTVSIGLKNMLTVGTPIFGKTRLGEDRIPDGG